MNHCLLLLTVQLTSSNNRTISPQKMKQAYIVCFSIIWMVAIFADYWNKHLLHQQGIKFFDQWQYLIIIVSLTLVSGFLMFKSPRLAAQIKRPILLLPYFILLILVGYLVNTPYSATLNSNEYVALTSLPAILSVLWKSISSLCLLGLIWIAPYSLGHWVRSRLGVNLAKQASFTLDLVIGLGVYSLFLFVIALLQLFYLPVILILLLFSLLINYKHLWSWFKSSILDSRVEEVISPIGWALLSVVMIVFSINFLADIIPFPSGFDSRNYYMNITKLIATNNGMVTGFQPYPWQLFMAQGHLLTAGKGMLPQLISMSSAFFVCVGLFEICGSYLHLSKSQSYLALALFIITPAIQNHLFIEIKVDLGLLLVQCGMLIFVLDRLHLYSQTQQIPSPMDLILLGFITGYGASIKTLNFYLLFALLVALWSITFRYKGFLATFLLSIAVILIAKFDSVSGMNQYHLSISLVKYLTLIIGTGMLLWIATLQRIKFITAVKQSAIFIAVLFATLSPWFLKNFVESGSLDPNTLIRGAEPGPEINMQLIRKNYPPK